MKQLLILKAGGEVLDHPHLRAELLEGFLAWPGPKVLVHGGGKQGTALASQLGIETQMVNGRRITSLPMLEVAVMVYGGLLNKGLVAELQASGTAAIGVTGADLDLVRAHKRPAGAVDYGWVGDVDAIGVSAWQSLLEAGHVPVLAPLSHDGKGQLLNTNADSMASAVATGLAHMYEAHLVFAFDKPGVLLDVNRPESLLPEISPASYTRLKAGGAVSGGMLPKLDNAFSALEAGVHRVYLCAPGAVSRLGTADFSGTMILPE